VIGIVVGLVAFGAMLALPPPAGLDIAAWRVAALGVLMAVWWLTEAAPVAVTALLPIGLLPALGGASLDAAARPYANPLIFLFLGGFMVALAMERWNLHKRVALFVLSAAGDRQDRIVGGFMVATAVLSMWVSNTATALIMLPVALSVIDLMPADESDGERRQFALALLLGVAYSASIGGLATLIGTPPNALMAGFMLETYGVTIGFAEWMAVGLPVSLVMLAIAWWLLCRWLFRVRRQPLGGLHGVLQREADGLGPLSPGERATAVIFAATALAWVFRPVLEDLLPSLPLSDPGIAITAAIVLFVVPVRNAGGGGEWTFVMTWDWARRLPWNVLILFGGGLSLAAAISATGLAGYIGDRLTGLDGLPIVIVILAVSATILVLTELTSNTATTAAFLPVIAALAIALGEDPLALVVPAALAASCAFMMPVATPPNAIVFAKGLIGVPTMARAGVWLNIAALALITLAAYLLVPLTLAAPG
jgi:sodium-dependent dicarboxylate transporter 2/3/5